MYLDPKRTATDTINKRIRHKIYNNSRWRKLRLLKFANNPLCEHCLLVGIVTATTDIHHIVPIDIDPTLSYSYQNLLALCQECHHKVHDNMRKAISSTSLLSK
jgi:5-methylcytosine-specific restriction enzyme A